MARASGLNVITANRLHDGVVIYWAESGDWVVDIDAACVDADAESLLSRAKVGDWSLTAVDAYAIEVTRTPEGHVHPTQIKEIIRTKGPTVRLDLGKQVWGPAGHATP
jgi:hypothetical protein